MTRAYLANYKAMEQVMQHVLSTPNHGVIMQPNTNWDRNETFFLGMQLNQNCGDAVGVYKCS